MTESVGMASRILIVDDSPDNRLLLQAMLTASGYSEPLMAVANYVIERQE